MKSDTIDLNTRIALRPREAAEALGVSDRTLRTWMRDEELPYLRIDRGILIPIADLKEWINERLIRKSTADDIAAEVLAGL